MDPARQPGGAAQAFAVTYLLLQSVGIAVFWIVLWTRPAARVWFVFPGAPDATFLSLFLADGVFLVGSGLIAARSSLRGGRRSGSLLWLHAGAAIYASLCALGMTLLDPRLWLGSALMAPVAVTPLAIALHDARLKAGLPRPEPTLARVLGRSFIQIVLFWSFFLIALPRGLILLEDGLGIARVAAFQPARDAGAIAAFVAGSSLGLWACWSLCLRGKGTPLPLDPTRELVIHGPYAFIRNPMAVGGLLQGLAVATWWGSGILVAYIVAGAVLWHVAIRPQEEGELREMFPGFDRYERNVRCWIPRITPYRSELRPA